MEEKQKPQQSGTDGMEPSIMEQKAPAPPRPEQKPRTKEIDEDTYVPRPEPDYAPEPQPREQQNYSRPQQYPEQGYQQEDYPQENYDTYAPSYDSDIMIEIAEQVFQEKTKKIQKQVDEINEFKTLAEVKIKDTSERLKRIETMIDKLQISILEKVGSY